MSDETLTRIALSSGGPGRPPIPNNERLRNTLQFKVSDLQLARINQIRDKLSSKLTVLLRELVMDGVRRILEPDEPERAVEKYVEYQRSEARARFSRLEREGDMTMTEHNQIQLPKRVVDHLRLSPGDFVNYELLPDGTARISK